MPVLLDASDCWGNAMNEIKLYLCGIKPPATCARRVWLSGTHWCGNPEKCPYREEWRPEGTTIPAPNPPAAPYPGEGWRLLKEGEIYCREDEYQLSDGTWEDIGPGLIGQTMKQSRFPIRRRVESALVTPPDKIDEISLWVKDNFSGSRPGNISALEQKLRETFPDISPSDTIRCPWCWREKIPGCNDGKIQCRCGKAYRIRYITERVEEGK